MITAIDTNILLDLLIPEARHVVGSEALLNKAYQQGALVISEAVYAELASQFPSPGEVDEFLRKTGIKLEQTQRESLQVASEAWRTYSSRRARDLQCSSYGRSQTVTCHQCGSPIQSRQHILSDFLIGGHALRQADRLLTRDRGYYRTYFPDLLLQEGE